MDWSTFFAAQLGASAALAGLLFVGLSINLVRILSFPVLLDRALGSLALLGTILVISSLALVPGQPTAALGAEIVVVGAVAWAMTTRQNIKVVKKVDKRYRGGMASEAALDQAAVLSYVAGGVVMLFSNPNGVYLLVPAIILSFVIVLIDAWVLLVEINR